MSNSDRLTLDKRHSDNMALNPRKERAKLWRVQGFHNLEVLKATYTNQTFTRHSHDCFGIGVVEQGRLDYHTAQGDYVIPVGDMVVINPGQVHWGGPVHETGCTYRIFYPDCAAITSVLTSLDEAIAETQLPYFGASRICDRTLSKQLLTLLTLLESPPQLTLQRESYLTNTLAHLITRYADPCPVLNPIGSEKSIIQRVQSYIEDCYAENISLQTLADLVQLKPLRLLRTFRKAKGLPPHAYLLQVRINHAKAMLSQGQAISEMAFSTGFADQSHLTRHFKKFVGVTPGQYAMGCGKDSTP